MRGLSRFPCEMEPTSWVQSTYTFSSYLQKVSQVYRLISYSIMNNAMARSVNFEDKATM